MHWLIEIFGELVPVPENVTLYSFSRDHMVLAIFVAFMIIGVVLHLIIEAYSGFAHQIGQITRYKKARPAIIIISTLWFILSIVIVLAINRQLEPAPILSSKQIVFIREPIVLSWSYSEEKTGAPATFDVEESNSSDFKKSLHFVTGGNSWYSYAGDGEKWWRVRAKKQNVLGRPSQAIKTSAFKSAYDRIRDGRKLIVYVSNEISLGIFKSLDRNGNMVGFDIELSKEIAKELSAEMNVYIEPVFIPTTWNELFSKPSEGTADMIVSAITKTDARENEYQLKFSKTYFCTGESAIYRRGNFKNEISSSSFLAAVNGKGVGYPKGTTSEKLVEDISNSESGKTHFFKKSLNEAEEIVQRILAPNANIQFGIVDTSFAIDRALQESNGSIGYANLDRKDFSASILPDEWKNEYGVGVAAGETKLVEIINRVIDRLLSSKQISFILEKATSERFPDIEYGKRAFVYKSDCE